MPLEHAVILFRRKHPSERRPDPQRLKVVPRETLGAEHNLTRTMISWSKLGLPALAKKAGYGFEHCYYNGYAIPTQQAHSTVLAVTSASMLKDDAPWLYELGIEAYRTARRGRTPEAQHAIRRFRKVLDFSMRGPFAEELGFHPKKVHMMLREMEEFLMMSGDFAEDQTPSEKASEQIEGANDQD